MAMRLRLCERGLLLRRGFFLIFRLPLLVRHAVDRLACFILGHRDPAGGGLLLIPVGQTVAAEPGEVHEIDVLNVGALTEMSHQLAERCCFEFDACVFVVGGHDDLLLLWRGASPLT